MDSDMREVTNYLVDTRSSITLSIFERHETVSIDVRLLTDKFTAMTRRGPSINYDENVNSKRREGLFLPCRGPDRRLRKKTDCSEILSTTLKIKTA